MARTTTKAVRIRKGPAPEALGPTHSSIRTLLGASLIIFAVLLAYLPALQAGYVWDDDWYVTRNTALRSVDGLRRIWFEPGATVQYYPLAFTSFWIEYHLWGLWPFGYHLVNVLLHACGAILAWSLLRRLSVPGAWLAAGLFALHPVHVESVAWITERKNVLSGVFYLLSLLAYVRFTGLEAPIRRDTLQWRFYILSVVLFVCALLSKTVTCTLPAVLLFLLWWKRSLPRRIELLSLLPMFAIALLMALVTVWMEKYHVGARGEDWNLSLSTRCLIANRAIWFYLGKLIYPTNLAFFYPRWRMAGVQWQDCAGLAMTVMSVVALWFLRARLGKGPLVAALFFGATLLPALGFVDVYPMRFSFVANHFQYLASLGPLALIAAALASIPLGRLATRLNADSPGQPRLLLVLRGAFAAAVLLCLALLTTRQARAYHDSETLWRDTIAKNPDAWLAYNNLGNDLVNRGDHVEAARLFREALRIKPDYADGYHNLANALWTLGQAEEALAHYRRALELKPRHPEAHNGLGIILDSQGRSEEAAAHFRQAVALRPAFAEAHNNLALLLAKQGNDREAIEHFRLALQSRPDLVNARINLADALLRQNDYDGAIAELTEAVRLAPSSPEAHNGLANALVAAGRDDQAEALYRRALELRPDFADAHHNLGLLLVKHGRLDQAIPYFARAIKLRPAYPEAYNALAGALASQGRLDEAIAEVAKALELKPDYADAHRNLALALTMTGRLAEAVHAYRRAIELRPDDVASRCDLAQLLLMQGDSDAALAQYREVLRIDPHNARATKAVGGAPAP
jgi:tetratricopeptide (TPR) repeat protein